MVSSPLCSGRDKSHHFQVTGRSSLPRKNWGLLPSVWVWVVVPLGHGHEWWPALMRTLYWTSVVKKQLSQKAKLKIYQPVYIQTWASGSEQKNCIANTSSQNEFPFFLSVAGLHLRDKIWSVDMLRQLRLEPLLVCGKGSLLFCFGHLIRILFGCLPLRVFQANTTCR